MALAPGGIAAVVTAARPRGRGAQRPRLQVVPRGRDHAKWGEVKEFVAALGVELDPWQERVLRVSLRRAHGRWAAFAVAVCAPRQNGKNGILEARELVGPLILGERLLVHSAHLADTSKEAFRKLDDLIDMHEWLSAQVRHVWRTNGHEALEFMDGRRIRFRTRTRGGGRGFSADCVIFDEAMFLPEVSLGAILPVISARPDPQVWYTGSAVDQLHHDDGSAFTRVRERALERGDPRLAYFEWSLDYGTPDDVPEEVAADPAAWARTNPALGIRIRSEYVESERRELDPRTFAVERLGTGDWPDLDAEASAAIPLRVWDALADPGSVVRDPVCVAFDVTPDRSAAAVAAAGLNEHGVAHVEVVEHRRGTGWVVARLAQLAGAHELVAVACDATGPASSLVHLLEEEGVPVLAVSASDHARACGLIFDLADQGALAHLGSEELRSALRGATRRPLGDAWAWSRRSSGTDISPLVAATLALWGSSTLGWDAGQDPVIF